jgi:hypothetical protein
MGTNMTKYKALAVTGAMLGLIGAAQAKANSGDGIAGSVGGDFSSGTYGGDTRTDILVVPLALRYRAGNLRVTAALPWLHIAGSSAVVSDGDGGVIIDPHAPGSSRSGVGDMSIAAAYSIPEEALGLGLEMGARVKLPTGSPAKALGTGKVDFALSAEVSKTLGKFTPFISAGYRLPGQPKGSDLRNAWSASVGSSLIIGKSVLIGSYDYRQASSALASDSHEIFGAFSAPVSHRLILTLYGSGGLSKGAPAYGVGSSLTLKI